MDKVIMVGIGLLFVLIGIVVGVFKQTWLISGVNTMSKEKKAKMDLDYVAKYFGLFFGIFGGIMISGVFICSYLNVMNYFHRSMPIAIISFCAFIILYFNVFKRKRIYKKNTGQTETGLQTEVVPAKKWPTILATVTVVSVGLLIYMGYQEPKVEIASNSLKIKGLYGINLSFSEITKADTIAWKDMPSISIRTNGISLNKVHRGKYRTTDGDKIHMSIHSGVSPVIKIVAQGGSVYYINRKNADETRQIFNKLNIQ
jgi:hypothetical protein